MATVLLIRYSAIVFALVLVLVGTTSPLQAAPEPPDGKCKPEEIVAYAKRLDPLEQIHYFDKLGKAKDFRALEAIYQSRSVDCTYAANVTVQILDSDKAIAFLASLELGSPTWCDAVLGLRYHPKEKVIGYLKQIAATTDREARYMCYNVCQSKGWDDLVPYARKDVDDRAPLLLSDLPPLDCLGKMATEYMESLKKKK